MSQSLFSFEIAPEEQPSVEQTPSTNMLPSTDSLPDAADLSDWMKARRLHYLLGELVIRAKTIEANQLHSAGTDAELAYLQEAYGGDVRALCKDAIEMARYVRKGAITPRQGLDTQETKL